MTWGRDSAWTLVISTSGARADVLDKKSRRHFVGFHVVFTTRRRCRSITSSLLNLSIITNANTYINGVYCEISLPRFLIRFLFFVKRKQQLVFVGVAFILNHSHIFLDMQKSQSKKITSLWCLTIHSHLSYVHKTWYIWKKLYILKIRTCNEILAYNGPVYVNWEILAQQVLVHRFLLKNKNLL